MNGRNTLYLAQRGFAVKAIDLSEAGIAKLERLAQEAGLVVRAEVADATIYSIDSDYEAFVVVLLFQFLNERESLCLMREIKSHRKSS